MQIRKSQENGVTVLTVIGQLTSPTSPLLEAAINNVLDTEDKIILDFGSLDFLASSGIRVILSTQKKINGLHGSLVIRNVNDVVMEVFEMTGLKGFIDIQ